MFCPTKLINTTNYREQAKGLPVKNEYQLAILGCSDSVTLVRETHKMATVAGCVGGVVCCALQLSPAIAVKSVITCGVSWCLSSCCARYCEPHAQKLIEGLREEKRRHEETKAPTVFVSPYLPTPDPVHVKVD